MVPPRSDRISRVPPYSRTINHIAHTGLSPATARLSRRFRLIDMRHWPGPRSLATTNGVSVDVLSSGYLDVSVPRVRFLPLWIQNKIPFIDTWKPFRLSSQTTSTVLFCPHGRTALRADLRTGRAIRPDARPRLRCYAPDLFPRQSIMGKQVEARRASQGRPAVAARAARPRRPGHRRWPVRP